MGSTQMRASIQTRGSRPPWPTPCSPTTGKVPLGLAPGNQKKGARPTGLVFGRPVGQHLVAQKRGRVAPLGQYMVAQKWSPLELARGSLNKVASLPLGKSPGSPKKGVSHPHRANTWQPNKRRRPNILLRFGYLIQRVSQKGNHFLFYPRKNKFSLDHVLGHGVQACLPSNSKT